MENTITEKNCHCEEEQSDDAAIYPANKGEKI